MVISNRIVKGGEILRFTNENIIVSDSNTYDLPASFGLLITKGLELENYKFDQNFSVKFKYFYQ
jgi:hypothetical protein